MGNDIKTGSTTGSDYWAAYVGGAKIKKDYPKCQTRTDVITYSSYSESELKNAKKIQPLSLASLQPILDFQKDFNLFYIPWSVGWWTFVDTGLSTWAKSVKTPQATEVTGSTASSRRAVVRRTDERHDPTVCLSKSWLAFGSGWLCLAEITMAGLPNYFPKIMNTFFVLKD